MSDPTSITHCQRVTTNSFWFPHNLSTSVPTFHFIIPYSFSCETDVCCICLDGANDDDECVRLNLCSGEEPHGFHKKCIIQALTSTSKCPYCQLVYDIGVSVGNQPPGQMSVSYNSEYTLPGEEPGTYGITYVFPDGIQSSNHYHPGQPYTGTIRKALLPGGSNGRAVLRKFMRAWDARILFTIGTSLTTGLENCVIWNNIHHKTNVHGGPTSFGFPDPDYIRRVTDELAAAGIK